MPRAAIVQLGGVHEEVVPSLIDALGPDWDVGVWLNAKCRDTRGDLFAEIPLPRTSVHNQPLGPGDWDRWHDEVTAFAPDIVIMSTYQRDSAALWVRRLDVPVFGVVHNTRMAMRSEEIARSITSGAVRPLTLAHHVAAALHAATNGALLDGIGIVEPVYWGDPGTPDPHTRRIAVPGGVNANNRDFAGLLSAISDPDRARALRDSNTCIDILGGGPDRAGLETQIASQGLDDIVRFAPLGANGRVHYDAYVDGLRRSRAILPLIPLHKKDYRSFKITSAIPTGIAFARPFVLDRWTASVYRCPSVMGGATTGADLDALLGLGVEQTTRLRADLDAYRSAARARNRTELARLRTLP